MREEEREVGGEEGRGRERRERERKKGEERGKKEKREGRVNKRCLLVLVCHRVCFSTSLLMHEL